MGWIPLEAGHAIEDLDDYAPEPEVHAFLRSRLLNFPIDTLYELHYQMITLGKVFCSKSDPNCKACPMQSHCEYAENDGPSLHGRKRQKVWQYEDNNTIKTPQKVEKAKKFTDTSDHILYGAGGTANIKFEHDWEARDLPLEHLISLRSTRVRSHRRINIRLDDASNTLIEEMKTELYYLASHSLYQRFTPWIPVQLLRECHDKESRSIWDAVDDKEHVIEVVTCLPRDINSFSSDLSAMPVWDMEDIGTWDTEVMPSARLYKYSKYALNANNLEEAPGYSKINKGNVVETALEREDVQQGDQRMGDNQVGEPESINALKMGFEVPPAEMTFPTEKGMEDTELGCLIENLHQFEIELEAINSLTETSMETHGADSDSNK